MAAQPGPSTAVVGLSALDGSVAVKRCWGWGTAVHVLPVPRAGKLIKPWAGKADEAWGQLVAVAVYLVTCQHLPKL